MATVSWRKATTLSFAPHLRHLKRGCDVCLGPGCDRHAREPFQRVHGQEKAVKDLEAQMASPGFYDQRARAEQAGEEHKKLMWEVGDLMGQWEALQAEVEPPRP